MRAQQSDDRGPGKGMSDYEGDTRPPANAGSPGARDRRGYLKS
jgi:hypothetical protein